MNEQNDKIDVPKRNEYLIDVARSSSYQNQSEEYYQKFGEWRSKKNNPFGYDYVKDSRERSYIKGKGYVHDGPDKAERIALLNCFAITGIMMVIIQLITMLQMLVMPRLGGETHVSLYFYSFKNHISDISLKLVCILNIFSITKLLIPIVLFFAITKMPFAVSLPRASKKNPEITTSGVAFMLMATVFGRFGNYGLSKLFALINIDISGFNMIYSSDPRANAVYFVSECIVVSILTEVLFRGIILQTFRQYGDFFALVMTCFFEMLYVGDFTMCGYIFLSSAVIGLFTIRSGSIYTAMIMRISARVVNFLASIGSAVVDDNMAIVTEAVISVIVIGFALFTYSRLMSKKNCNFNITDSYTHLTTKSKFLILLSSKAVVSWLVLVFITMIFNIRFLE